MKKGHNLHVVQIEFPKDWSEIPGAMKHLVEHYYETMAEHDDEEGCPNVFFLAWLCSDKGPIKDMAKVLAERWGVAEPRVGAALSICIGMAARHIELEYCVKHNLDEDHPHEWIEGHHHRISFLLTAATMTEHGVGCPCAFCHAVWVAARFERGEGWDDDLDTSRGRLKEILIELNQHGADDRDESKCALNVLNTLAEMHHWKKPKIWAGRLKNRDEDAEGGITE